MKTQVTGNSHRAGYAPVPILLGVGIAAGAASVGISSLAPPKPLHPLDDPGLHTLGVAVADEMARTTGPDVRAVLDQYCVVCHDQTLLTAGLALDDAVDVLTPGTDPETWEKVVGRLRTGTMPPGGMPRPEPSVYDDTAEWLEGELDKAWEASPRPGRIATIHRLNRTEYSNVVNDLLGLEVDWTSQLPGDETADGGFDNVADALTISPAHVQRYLSVARRATRMAMRLPSSTPRQETYRTSDAKPQNDRMSEDLPLGSRGGLAVRHHFPTSGEYIISIPRFLTNYHGYVDGMGWPQELFIALDGEVLGRFTVGGGAQQYRPTPHSYEGAPEGPGWQASVEWEDYMQGGAVEGIEVRVDIEAGPHLVSAYFSRDVWVAEPLLRQPPHQVRGQIDAQSNEEMNYAGAQEIRIDGPYNSADVPVGPSASINTIVTCEPDTEAEEEVCATQILSRLAERAYRRPVADNELQVLLDFFRKGREDGGSFDDGIQFGLERLLVDPALLLRVTRDPPAGAGPDPGSYYTLSDYEVATRLSFFLWGSLPDDTLLALAKEGRLTDPPILRAQVKRMFADPRSQDHLVSGFAAQWLNLGLLKDRTYHQGIYIDYDENLLDAFRQETELFFAGMLREDRSLLDLLRADHTYLNERLARHYEIQNVVGSHFRRVMLPDLEARGGLLGHASILSLTSYPDRTSPVLRGKWILENVVGFSVPAPPPNVDTSLKDDGEEPSVGQRSIRERLAQHRANPACATCHSVLDPLGLALEGYDATGARRQRDERGNRVLEGGSWPGGIDIEGLPGLRTMLLEQRGGVGFASTLTGKLMSYALGRELEYYDQPVLRQILRDTKADDYRWSSIILAIVESPAFLMRESVGM